MDGGSDSHGARSGDQWPEADLEHLGRCPCCASLERVKLLDGLRDFAFGAAPGDWTMWRCSDCRCGYLDPRPTPASIGRAYENYFTHTEDNGPKVNPTPKFKALTLANQLAGSALDAAFKAAPAAHAKWRRFHHLSRHAPLPEGPGRRWLDVGCGAGGFLQDAAAMGYEPVGMDFDEAAVKVAGARGFEVHVAGPPGSGLPKASFAHVSMSNVLEHLHDPVGALSEVRDLLEPGGRLWLSQPNLGAAGLDEFGIYWRGLEPPRHLTLWDVESLIGLLKRCGFERVRALPANLEASAFYFEQSDLQRRGFDPYGPARYDPANGLDARTRNVLADAVRRSIDDPSVPECLTIVGYRPRR